MDRKGSALVILIVSAAVLLITGGVWYYEAHKVGESQTPKTQSATTTSSVAEATSTPGDATSIAEEMIAKIKNSNPSYWAGDIIGYETSTQDLFIGHGGSECCGGEIDIYSLSSPTSTQPISKYATEAYTYSEFIVARNYLFIAPEPDGPLPAPTLLMVDISNPSAPKLVASPTFDNNNEIVQGIQFNGKYIVLTGKLLFPGEPSVEPINFSQTIDFSNINNLQIVDPLPSPEIFSNPNGPLLEWQENGLDYSIVNIIKNYSRDPSGNVLPNLTFSVHVSNNATSTRLASVNIQEIDGSGRLVSGISDSMQVLTMGPGDGWLERMEFDNPTQQFVTGGVPNISFVVDLSSTSSLVVVPSSPEVPATSTEPLITVLGTSTIATTTLFTSSSSAQVGNFTVVVDCDALDGLAVLKQIEIFKQDNLVQTISGQSIESGGLGGGCPKPEVRDINNDGYPDFMIVYNYGNEYTDSEYWLYSSSSDQFSCPNIDPTSNKPWMDCSLTEPN